MKRSCGPKCLLFISNYVFRRQPPQFFFSIKSVKQKQVKITIMISDIRFWMYRLGLQQIHIISISGHYIVIIWQIVAGTSVYFTICLESNIWRVFAIWPTVGCLAVSAWHSSTSLTAVQIQLVATAALQIRTHAHTVLHARYIHSGFVLYKA